MSGTTKVEMTVEQELKSFPSSEGIPRSPAEIRRVLNSSLITKVVCYLLGPEGTNIGQTGIEWIEKMGIGLKTEVVFTETPEEALMKARKIKVPGEIGMFWTCAVFYALKDLFFENPDVFPFFVIKERPLDEMQLATTEDRAQEIFANSGVWPEGWSVASHPSPAPLVKYLQDRRAVQIIKANSNSHAASMCVNGDVSGCITTESSRKIYNLVKIHSFGSPPMIFFGGITSHGVRIVREVYSRVS